MFDNSISTAAILDIFTQEVLGRGGRVSDTFQDDRRLFVRALLPMKEEIRQKDGFQGGLALRSTDGDVCLHPYLFRQVCRNGAIMAHSLDSFRLEHFDALDAKQAEFTLREAIATCSAPEVFAESMDRVRTAIDAEAEIMLNMMPLLGQLQQAGMGRILAQILEQFSTSGDRSRYGLMNAVTSVARDTEDPDDRWRLEELGGGIGAGIRPRQPATPSRRYANRDCVPVM
jgi:hypothetical protein